MLRTLPNAASGRVANDGVPSDGDFPHAIRTLGRVIPGQDAVLEFDRASTIKDAPAYAKKDRASDIVGDSRVTHGDSPGLYKDAPAKVRSDVADERTLREGQGAIIEVNRAAPHAGHVVG